MTQSGIEPSADRAGLTTGQVRTSPKENGKESVLPRHRGKDDVRRVQRLGGPGERFGIIPLR